MEELVALEAPPRTLDVQQFAKARAAELLSLHTVLKKKKKKKPRAQPQQDACISSSHVGELQEISTHNRGDDEDDSNIPSSLPRHLRRRTSSYTRRRRPLPWLYKKKRKAPPSSSLSLSFPNKRLKRQLGRQKKGKTQQQNPPDDTSTRPSRAGGDIINANQIPPLPSEVVVSAIASTTRDGPPALTQRGGHGVPQEERPKLHAEQNNLQQVQQRPDCIVASSFQASGDGIAPTARDCIDACTTLVSADDVALMDVDGAAAWGQTAFGVPLEDITPFQVDKECAAFQSAHGMTQVGSNATQQDTLACPPQVDGDTGALMVLATSTVAKDGHGVHEDATTFPSQADKDGIVSIGEGNPTTPARTVGHAVQQEDVPQEGDHAGSINVDGVVSPVQTGRHGVQQEAISLPFQVNKDGTAVLGEDVAVAPAIVGGHVVQQDDVDLPSYVDGKGIAPTCAGGIPALAQGGTLEVEQGAANVKKKKKVCRPLRRLLEFRSGGSLISLDGIRRLGTHVWHAKRFAIEKKWGYYIPLGRPGRGHGSRSILRWSKDKALLHDSSFINAIQLHGKEEKIMQVLQLVLEFPQGSDFYLEAGQTDSPRRCFSTALLHHVGKARHNIISSVIVMWKPVMPELTTPICAANENEELKERDLWLWVHAAAFEEAFRALKDICYQLNEEMKDERVECFSKRGDLGRVDLIGEQSFAVLQKVLFPVYRDQQNQCLKLHELSEVINPNQVKGKELVHMEVSDPRLRQSERCLALDPTPISSLTVFEEKTTKSQEFSEEANSFVEGGPQQEALGELSVTMEEEKHNCCCSNEAIDSLWACEANSFQCKLRLPVKEKFLSRMRHTDRLDSFGFIQESVKINRMLERRKSLVGRFTCPVILLRHEHERASACGWSIILPLSWILAFWVPLVFAGGHAIGIRERHWLYTDAGIPSFPDDFPDSKAYAELMAAKSLQDDRTVRERVTKKRLPVAAQTSESVHTEAVYSPYVHCPNGLLSCAIDEGNPGCFVARTLERLVNHLQVTHQSGLLLFPAQRQTMEKFKCLGKRCHEGTIGWRVKSETQEARSIHSVRRLCLLRVSIRPFRKGVVEVGATVYAPTSEDYRVWSCMEKATMTSESGVQTCDGLKRAIGYVTSMAPRGSKSCAGIAFCDAIALGLVRGRQWVETTWHKNGEIFLMFCNKGSSTFRPAFASVCLEGGPDI